MPRLFDSHSHINANEFDADRPLVIDRMRQAGLVGALVLGCDRSEIDGIKDLVHENPGFLYGAWALHPEYADVPETSVNEICDICSAPEITAVGETGLDFHWCHGDLTWQKERFRMHIRAAKILKKPLVVHAREAEKEAVEILKEEDAGDVGFVMHCFAGDKVTAFSAIDAGGMISFTGVITFKSAGPLREVARALSLEYLMIETDCPYMAPVPYRGKRNEPAFTVKIAECLASLKGTDVETISEMTTANALQFFRLEK
ncbi:MAG: TatD family hydrolase [Duodenibacillus sp.]|nr:TatD family hydrolase [Duodenibacillus sp.]